MLDRSVKIITFYTEQHNLRIIQYNTTAIVKLKARQVLVHSSPN